MDIKKYSKEYSRELAKLYGLKEKEKKESYKKESYEDFLKNFFDVEKKDYTSFYSDNNVNEDFLYFLDDYRKVA